MSVKPMTKDQARRALDEVFAEDIVVALREIEAGRHIVREVEHNADERSLEPEAT